MRIWTIGVFSCLHLHKSQDKNIPLLLLSRSPAFSLLFGSLTPVLHHNWKRNLAPRLGQGREKNEGIGERRKSFGNIRRQILRAISSWAKGKAPLLVSRLFFFPVVVNCSWFVITVIAVKETKRGESSWQMFQMATKALLKSCFHSLFCFVCLFFSFLGLVFFF